MSTKKMIATSWNSLSGLLSIQLHHKESTMIDSNVVNQLGRWSAMPIVIENDQITIKCLGRKEPQIHSKLEKLRKKGPMIDGRKALGSGKQASSILSCLPRPISSSAIKTRSTKTTLQRSSRRPTLHLLKPNIYFIYIVFFFFSSSSTSSCLI